MMSLDYKKLWEIWQRKYYLAFSVNGNKRVKDLKKVIGIGLVDSIFEKEMSQWYHHYQLRHTEKPDKILEDFQLLLIELPKYRTRFMTDKSILKLLDLWLQFLSLGEKMHEAPRELLAVPEIERAVHLAEVGAYSEAELHSYERNLDAIRTESTLIHDHREEGRVEGEAQGIVKGEARGIVKGEAQGRNNLLKAMLSRGTEVNTIAEITGLSIDDIQALVSQ